MKFRIEQLAIYPRSTKAAMELLCAMGLVEWSHDTVQATGEVFGIGGTNTANLAFNYQADRNNNEPPYQSFGAAFKPLEFEVLEYMVGNNWIDDRPADTEVLRDVSVVSHLGMHCSDEELVAWKSFFQERNIRVAQEVQTHSHTNPVINGKRQYTYCIFDTRHILGFDVKLIVRREVGRSE